MTVVSADQLLKEACKLVPKNPVLINAISQRARELLRGDKSLVDASQFRDVLLTSLREIAEGKVVVQHEEIKN